MCFQMNDKRLDNNEHKQNLPEPVKQKLVQAVWQMSAIGELNISKVSFNTLVTAFLQMWCNLFGQLMMISYYQIIL